MDLYKYLSNGVTCKGYNSKNCYNKLIKEFEKGNVSYPRSDGENHIDITILNSSRIDKDVKEIILYKDNNTFIKTDSMIQGDIFMLARELKLTTPSSIIDDLEKAKSIKIDKNEKVDLLIGIKKDRMFQENCLSIDRENFNFDNFLKDCYSNEKVEIGEVVFKEI